MSRKKNLAGRPTVMTEPVVSKLEVAFCVGASVTEACLVAGISRESYYVFVRENPDYSDRFKQLQQKTILAAKKRIADAIEDGDTATARWLLERRCKEEYGQHHKLQIESKAPETPEEVVTKLNALLDKIRRKQQIGVGAEDAPKQLAM